MDRRMDGGGRDRWNEGSVVFDSSLYVLHIVCWGSVLVFDEKERAGCFALLVFLMLVFVLLYMYITLCPFYFCNYLDEKERAGCLL